MWSALSCGLVCSTLRIVGTGGGDSRQGSRRRSRRWERETGDWRNDVSSLGTGLHGAGTAGVGVDIASADRMQTVHRRSSDRVPDRPPDRGRWAR